jgi:hypothetical protein
MDGAGSVEDATRQGSGMEMGCAVESYLLRIESDDVRGDDCGRRHGKLRGVIGDQRISAIRDYFYFTCRMDLFALL